MEFLQSPAGRHVAGPIGEHEYRAEIVELDDGRHRLTSSTFGFPLDQTTWERLQDAKARAEVELRTITTVTPGALRDPSPRVIAGGRESWETCEDHTAGCRIDHTLERERGSSDLGCEVW